MEEPGIGVGLVGFGLAGRFFHAPVIRAVPGLRLKSVVQRHGDSARETFPEVGIVRDVEALLSDPGIRLVVIATPNQSHYGLARQCLLAGRDVVVDKPFTVTSAEGEELIRIARAQGRLLSVYHNRRFDSDFRTVQRLIAGGAFGRLVRLESRYDRYRPAPRPGVWRERDEPAAGLLYDLGSHLIDQALTLFGAPQAVSADLRVERRQALVDDAFDVVLHYPGLRVQLSASMLACSPGPRFLLYGTQGTYIKYGTDPQEEPLRAGRQPGGPGWGVEEESQWGTLTPAGGPPQRVPSEPGDYRLYYDNVRAALEGTAALAVTPEQAVRAVRVIELARESDATTRTVDWLASIR
ncbi:MAG: oxidoreductase [Bryobacterales bacterium]|nr:oxidoreductase [Bryobacterales bacterium]